MGQASFGRVIDIGADYLAVAYDDVQSIACLCQS
jgi:hypothetical protein